MQTSNKLNRKLYRLVNILMYDGKCVYQKGETAKKLKTSELFRDLH